MNNVIQGSNQLSLTNEIGCGKYYENIVLYAHSTGALVAAMYALITAVTMGVGEALLMVIFNSPFWS